MGLKYKNFFLIEMAQNYFGDNFTKIKMLELGNQQIRRKTYPLDSPVRKYGTTKQYFTSLGIEHVSIDINGRMGAINMDLSRPLNRPEWINYFDCSTDFGTIEHVGNNGKTGQYNAFRTVHEMTKKNGVMIHILCLDGFSIGHCVYYYKKEFVDKLAKANQYDIMYNDVGGISESVKWLRFIYVKKHDNAFMNENDFVIMPEVVGK